MATVKKIAAELNLEFDKQKAYGTYQEFTYTLYQNISYANSQDNFKILYIPMEKITDEVVGRIDQFISDHKKELRIFKYTVGKDLLTLRLNEGFKGINSDMFKEIYTKLINHLLTLDVHPKKTCVYCQEENPDTIIYINDIKLPAHEHCKQEAMLKNEALRKEKESQRNGLNPLLGTILGAFIGVIPYAIAVWFGWYVGILTFLTGYAAYKGFMMFGGNTIKSTKFMVSIIALVMIILSNFGIIEMLAIINNVPFRTVLYSDAISSIFFEMLGMSLLFGVLGISAVFVKIKKDEYSTVIE